MTHPTEDERPTLSDDARAIYQLACKKWGKGHKNWGLASIMQAIEPCADTVRYCLEAGAEYTNQAQSERIKVLEDALEWCAQYEQLSAPDSYAIRNTVAQVLNQGKVTR